MKNLFKSVVAMLMIGAMAMTVGCNEYDDDIKDINDRLDQLTTGTISPIKEQVDAMKLSLSTLTATTIPAMQQSITALQNEDTAIKNLIAEKERALTTAIGDAKTELQNQINDLKTAKTAIEGRLTSLEATLGDATKGLVKKVNDIAASLSAYETMAHAQATYATIANHQALVDIVNQMKLDYATVANLNTELAKYVKSEDLPNLVSGELTKAINASTSSLNVWLGNALEDALAAYTTSDDLALLLANYSTTDNVFATYTKSNAAFKAGVDECIAAALAKDGEIDKAIAAKLKDVTDKYDAILKGLRVDVDKLMSRLQSLVYVPTNASGKAYVSYIEVGNTTIPREVFSIGNAVLTYKVRPADAAEDLAAAWAADPTIMSMLVQMVDATRAAGSTMTITKITGDNTTGNIVVNAKPVNFNRNFFIDANSNGMYSVALAIKHAVAEDAENSVAAKDIDITSDYVNLRSEMYSGEQMALYLHYDGDNHYNPNALFAEYTLAYNNLKAQKLLLNLDDIGVRLEPADQGSGTYENIDYFRALGFDIPDPIYSVAHDVDKTGAVDPTSPDNFAYKASFTTSKASVIMDGVNFLAPDELQDSIMIKAVEKKSVGQIDNATHKFAVVLPYKNASNQTVAWTVAAKTKTTIVKVSSDFEFTAIDKYWKFAERANLDKIVIAATAWTNTSTTANNITNAQIFGDNNDFSDFKVYDAADASKTNLLVTGGAIKSLTFAYAAAVTSPASPETITYTVTGKDAATITAMWNAGKTYNFTCTKTLKGDDVLISGSFKLIGLPAEFTYTFATAPFTYNKAGMTTTSKFVAPTSDTKYTALMKHFTEAEFLGYVAGLTSTSIAGTYTINAGTAKTSDANNNMAFTYAGTPAEGIATLKLAKDNLTSFNDKFAYKNIYTSDFYNTMKINFLTASDNTVTAPAYKVRNVPAFCDKGEDWNDVFKEVKNYTNYWGVSLGQYAPNAIKPNAFSLATVKMTDLFEVLDLTGAPINSNNLAALGFKFKYDFMTGTEHGAATIVSNILDYKYKEGNYITATGELFLDDILLPDAYKPAAEGAIAYSPFRVYAQKPIAQQALGNGVKVINVINGETGIEKAYAYEAMSLKDKRGAELMDATATAMAGAWIVGGTNFADTFSSSVVYGGLTLTFGDFKLYYDAAHTVEATNINPITFNKTTGEITYDKASLVSLGRPIYMVIKPVEITNKWCVIDTAEVEFQFVPQK